MADDRRGPPAAHIGVYGISVAAELVGTGAQNLRLYEARGLVTPGRTDGGTRRYSADDIDRLRRITDLLDDGLNLAGVGRVLDLEQANSDLQEENSRLRATNARLRRTDRADPAVDDRSAGS